MKFLSLVVAGIVLSFSCTSHADTCKTGLIGQVGAIAFDYAWGGGSQRLRLTVSGVEYFSYQTLNEASTRSMLAVALSAYNAGQRVSVAGSYCGQQMFTQLTTATQ
jgi:hypothetical protein